MNAPMDTQAISSLLSDAASSPHVRTGVLMLARLTPIAAITPLLGGTNAPARFRFGVSILIAAMVAPVFAHAAPSPYPFFVVLVMQGIVGLTMALAIRLVFEVYSAAGRLIDDARGAGNAELYDPFNNQQQSQLGAFLVVTAVALFSAADGHAAFLSALVDGLEAFPPTAAAPPGSIGPWGVFDAAATASALMVSALKIASPVLAVTLLIDLALGLVNRLAPQIQASTLGLIMKGAASLGVTAFSIALILSPPVQSVASIVRNWFLSRP